MKDQLELAIKKSFKKKANQMAIEEPTYRRTHVLFFSEEISMVETLPESRHTLFCL